MDKKEFYRKNLPHLQIRGQTFFVTWLLADTLSDRNLLKLKEKFDKVKATDNNKSEVQNEELNKDYGSYFVEFDNEINQKFFCFKM